jgi:hypothetical protein
LIFFADNSKRIGRVINHGEYLRTRKLNEPNVDSGKWTVLAVLLSITKNAGLDTSCDAEGIVLYFTRFSLMAADATSLQIDPR